MCVDYESSELLLYQNMVIQESGDIEQALKHLDTHSKQIFDKVTIQETYGILYFVNMVLRSTLKY